MAKRVPLPPPGFDDLSVDKKMDDFQSLWDRIAATRAMVPVPAWHREVIDKRVTDLEADSPVTAGGCSGPSPREARQSPLVGMTRRFVFRMKRWIVLLFEMSRRRHKRHRVKV